jgi:hypothetical protein
VAEFHLKLSENSNLAKSETDNGHFVEDLSGFLLAFRAHFARNFLNVYRSKTCFKQKLWRNVKHSFYAQRTFPLSLTVFEMIRKINMFLLCRFITSEPLE